MNHTRFHALFLLFLLLITIVLGTKGVLAENIDPDNDGSRYAWGENVGWINFKPLQGPGVTVTGTGLTGYAWGENIGWINLGPFSPSVGGGVTIDDAGNLSGYAWNENVGWIKFDPSGGGVKINPATGIFSGYAWGENIGWISFGSTGPVPFSIKTSWRGDDGDGIESSIDTQPTVFSNDFHDAATTYGTITDRGNQTLLVTDEPNPSGVRIKVSSSTGSSPASVSVCGGSTILTLDNSDEVIVTCGSVEIRVIQGPVQVSFVGADGKISTTLSVLPNETVMDIKIDIKPGSYPNSINPKSKGKIPIAILSSAKFNAPAKVDRNSLRFGKTGSEKSLAFCNSSAEDINRDGLGDLMCHFNTESTGFQAADTNGVLRGKTLDGILIVGWDSVKIVP